MYTRIHRRLGEIEEYGASVICVEGHGTYQTVRLLLSPDILILSHLRGHFTRI